MGLMEALTSPSGDRGRIVWFVDPPYTMSGGKQAGKRLYTNHQVDHQRLFAMLADSDCDFLMTYDVTSETARLVDRYGFAAVRAAPRTAHHHRVPEMIITRRPVFV